MKQKSPIYIVIITSDNSPKQMLYDLQELSRSDLYSNLILVKEITSFKVNLKIF